MKVTLDTNCLIVILPKTSPYHCILQAFRAKRFTLCMTTDIIDEYCEILPRFFPQEFVNDLINTILLSENIQKTNIYYKWDLIHTDPEDNKFVDCALNSGADFIVTNDHHFDVLKNIEFPPIKVFDIEMFKYILGY